MDKITKSFSYMGSNVQKCKFLDIRGGGGEGWVAAMTGRILLPSYPLTPKSIYM